MSLTVISQTIRAYFNDNFNECPYIFENDTHNDTGAFFCKLTILTNEPTGFIGKNSCYREFGIVSINMFDPKNNGISETERVGDIIADLFKQKTVNGVKFELPTFTKIGLLDNYNQTNVSIDYSFNQSG